MNQETKVDPKMLEAGITILRQVLSFTQTIRAI